jgi:hypothetical protein
METLINNILAEHLDALLTLGITTITALIKRRLDLKRIKEGQKD